MTRNEVALRRSGHAESTRTGAAALFMDSRRCHALLTAGQCLIIAMLGGQSGRAAKKMQSRALTIILQHISFQICNASMISMMSMSNDLYEAW